MLNQFFELHAQKLSTLSPEALDSYIAQMLSIIYGSQEKAAERLKALCESENESDSNVLISKDLNVDFFQGLIEQFNGHTLSDLLNSFAYIEANQETLMSNISNAEMFKKQFETYKEVARLTFKMVYGIDTEMTKEVFAETFKNQVYFTLQDIATEFKTDRKTLRKWLHIIFPDDRYFKRRKLTILEYKEIFEKLFLAPAEHRLDITNHLNYYLQRIDNGMKFTKGELVALTDSDYKTLSSNAKKAVPQYVELNIFPYSIAMAIMKKLGSEPILIDKNSGK